MSDVTIPEAADITKQALARMGEAQLRPIPLKVPPPLGGFGDPEPAVYSHQANLDYAAARSIAQAIRSSHE